MSESEEESQQSMTKEAVYPEIMIEEKTDKQSGLKIQRSFKKEKQLGKGGFARCFQIKDQANGEVFAAKIIPKHSLQKTRSKQKLVSEIKIHKSLKHENIVFFDHVFEDNHNVYILLELCNNHTLSELIKRRKRITELEAKCYLFQIVNAIIFMHSKKVIHRDLKLGNIFLDDKLQVKLGDFGLATTIDFRGEKKRTVCGTPNYIAPEILDGNVGHSYEVDTWSLGVILYTLLIGKPPFETPDVKITYRRIKACQYEFPDHIQISSRARHLISSILQLNPTTRPSLDEILNSEFLTYQDIPQEMPIYTLACPPRKEFQAQFTNPQGSGGLRAASVPMKIQNKIGEGKKPFQQDLIKNEYNIELQGDKINYNVQFVYVVKMQFQEKHGLGYLLSNNIYGVFYLDGSQIQLKIHSKTIEYIDRNKGTKQYSLNEYPIYLKPKIKVLSLFVNCLNQQEHNKLYPVQTFKSAIQVKKHISTPNGQIIKLTNKIVQAQFNDKTCILIDKQNKKIFFDDGKNISTINMNQLQYADKQLQNRLKFIKSYYN